MNECLTVQLNGWSFSLEDSWSLYGEPRLCEAVVLLLWIGFRRTGLCIFPGAVLGRDDPGCSTHETHTISTLLMTNMEISMSTYFPLYLCGQLLLFARHVCALQLNVTHNVL